MPNWTADTVEINGKVHVFQEGASLCFASTGTPKDILKFKKHMRDIMDRLDACHTLSVEKETIHEHEYASPSMTVAYRFDTAWSPPEKVIANPTVLRCLILSILQQDWPEFEITGGYVGEGYEFCGSF